jgi:C4-dicarboxylate transporter, DctM subunit
MTVDDARPRTERRVAPVSPVPGWLNAIDGTVIAVMNLALVAEVAIVFLNTVLRATTNKALLPGLEELSRLFLIATAFLSGGVAYGRGRFMSITVLADRLPPGWRAAIDAIVAWLIIAIVGIIGGASLPLQIANSGEHTTMLGIGYIWLTAPMTLGCLIFMAHAMVRLARLPMPAAIAAGFVVAAFCLATFLGRGGDWIESSAFYPTLVILFVTELVIGVPVGFVLASVGIFYVWSTASAPVIAMASTAQRGSGGFIFLALPFFILAGFVMDRGAVGARIVNFLATLLGHFRGGMLQVSIVAMYVVSGISGSKAADMAAVGIPMNATLRRQGYDPGEAAAVLAASSAMGESIPPSIAILALGSVTSVSTGALFLAGLLPAAVIAVCLMIVVYWRARISRQQPAARASSRERWKAASRAFAPLLMPVVLVGGIIGGVGTPTEVSTFAVVYGLLLGSALYRKIGWREFWEVLTETSLLGGMVFFTFSGATLFSWSLSLEGVPETMAKGMTALGTAGFLPAVIFLTIILGALLESIVTIIILGPLLLPVAQQLGVDPLQYGVVMIESFGIGAILPPVGLALYIACAIGETTVDRAARPVLVYISVLCAGVLLVSLIPWITLVLPHQFNFH